jgi:general secretion pathway protein A
MYEQFFGLREPAFSLTPDPRFLWPSETHQEGLSALVYGIVRRKGFILLTGEVGTGKTTLLRAALDQLPRETEVALVMNTAGLEPLDLFKLIATELRIEGAGPSKVDYIIALNAFLLQQLQAGVNTVLVIDEAQNLTPELLEEVRLLSNLETDTEKLAQIVLTGQPELQRKLAAPQLRQLRQRIAVEHHIHPLHRSEVGCYLAHRIEVAGGSYEEVFAPDAESTFYDFSGGCPRLLSLLADRALLAAFAREIKPVPPALVEAKAKEMRAARTEGLEPEVGADG